jgi:hypothetical protein
MSDSENIILESFLICDQVITEAQTNKKSLIGIFNNIWSDHFPFPYNRFWVFIQLTNGQGRIGVDLRCVKDKETREILWSAKGEFDFPNPRTVVEMAFEFKNVVFPEPGPYAFELWQGDLFLHDKKFNVFKMKQ